MSPLRDLTARLLGPTFQRHHFHTARPLPRPMGGTIESKPIETTRVSTKAAKTEKTETLAEKTLTKEDEIRIKDESIAWAKANATYYEWTRGSMGTGC